MLADPRAQMVHRPPILLWVAFVSPIRCDNIVNPTTWPRT